nr:MAG TPA: hypothetical protein [Caudoviricetes sp.]
MFEIINSHHRYIGVYISHYVYTSIYHCYTP